MPQAKSSWGQRPTAKNATSPTMADLDKLVSGSKATVRLNAEIDADLRARFKAKCAMEKREIKEVLTDLIEAWMIK